MKRLFAAILLFGATMVAQAQTPLWLRGSAISPDGQTIAFTYKGDIFTVPTEGGRAQALTTNPSYDFAPIWSPDSRSIAFASDREGSMDVYIVSAEGGAPKRLTTHGGNETPVAFVDNNTILFSAMGLPDAGVDMFPSGAFNSVYKVSTKENSRPELYSSIPMEDISINGNKILYHDKKGYEDTWRKHHTSSITRDVWMTENGVYTKLTSFKGEDRSPVWDNGGKSFYYLSEQDGSFNIYKRDLTGQEVQITKHKKNPVRYLSASKDGLLCYGYDGEIYTVKEGGKPTKLMVSIVSDKLERDVVPMNMPMGASDIAISPSGKELAFILRGDVFTTSVEFGTTKRITNTPEQERNIEFSPDGRKLLYSSEREGVWNIYESSIAKEGESQFTYATEITEKALTKSKTASFQASYAPSGKEIAYYEDRTTLKVMDMDGKKTRTLLEGKFNYSYGDGDQGFEWSPDSKHILVKYIGVGGWMSPDMAVIEVATGNLTNLTESGYTDAGGTWVMDGKAMMWFSDKAGMRSHGSHGAMSDAYIMFFDDAAYDKFTMSKEERALFAEAEKAKKEADAKKDSKSDVKKDTKSNEKADAKKDAKSNDEAKAEDKSVLDFESRKSRVYRITAHSSMLNNAVLSKDGTKLYYFTSFEGMPDLWVRDFVENSTRILVKGAGLGKIVTDKENNNIFLGGYGGAKKIEMASGKVTPVMFNANFEYKAPEERKYMFEHTWNILNDKFYVTDLHGVDWADYRKVYEKFLPHINNGYDFAELLSEMLGELNASHTGARFGGNNFAQSTAELGAFYDNSYKGDGLKIAEIIKGGPLSKSGLTIAVGDVIQKIDGVEIKAGEDYYPLLAGKVGKMVELTVKGANGKSSTQMVKTTSAGMIWQKLLYDRWVDQRREMVKELSGGKIGYVHVKGMNGGSFSEVYSDLLGRYRNCDAVVVDTRFNGGGWLHDDLVTLLSGKESMRFTPRGNYVGSDPINKWLKPSIVIQNESNYSDAHGFTWLYKERGVGKLVGAPVAGTMTAVWWEGLIDGRTTIGIPQVAVQDMRGNYLENLELMPDIEVYNTPETVLKGRDLQLEAAVRELMKK